jgi:hypothetical protein
MTDEPLKPLRRGRESGNSQGWRCKTCTKSAESAAAHKRLMPRERAGDGGHKRAFTHQVETMRQTKLTIPLIATSELPGAQSDPPGRVGQLNYVKAPAALRPASEPDWVDVGVNRPLTTVDQSWVGDGGGSHDTT